MQASGGQAHVTRWGEDVRHSSFPSGTRSDQGRSFVSASVGARSGCLICHKMLTRSCPREPRQVRGTRCACFSSGDDDAWQLLLPVQPTARRRGSCYFSIQGGLWFKKKKTTPGNSSASFSDLDSLRGHHPKTWVQFVCRRRSG